MAVKFSPSVNIIRDAKKDLSYIVTSNGERAAATIADNFKRGIHSFTLIGSYGTGKSSFIWALEQTFNGKSKLLPCKIQLPNTPVKTLNFVGVYQSLIEHLAEEFEVKNDLKGNQRILDALYQEYEKVHKKNGLLVIAIDEFGKFLEYAVKNNPERELYFIQQLAEFANDSNRNVLFLTTLHQNFEAYASNSLSEPQKQEWRKIKGRLKEITFNEPPEQLLILAAQKLGIKKINKSADVAEVLSIQKKHSIFSADADLIKKVAGSLAPLDFFSAYIITLALQRYGQNERSLFTFLETEDLSQKSFTIGVVYDYLYNEYYAYLNTKNNLDYTQWAFIREAVERCEANVDEQTDVAIEIIKVIGLLSLFAGKGAKVDLDFLQRYFQLTGRKINLGPILKKIVNSKIIRFNTFSNSFKIFEGTDINIESELLHAANDVAEIDIVKKLKEYFDFPYVSAKSVSYIKGTPRFFSFEITEQLTHTTPQGEVDGNVVLILNPKLTVSGIAEHSKKDGEANIYGYFSNSTKIRDVIHDIEKTRVVKEKNNDDKVAVRELNNILNSQRQLLNHYVWDSLYSGDVIWIYNGKTQQIKSRKELNQKLSEICEDVYTKTPVFKNELINRYAISGAIHTARKNYFNALVNSFSEEDLGFAKESFPPEKTIYITLLKDTKLHILTDGGWDFNDFNEKQTDSNFLELWNASEEFLNSCQNEKRPLLAFFEILSARPFKLKQGFLEFWIPTYLFIKRDDFALYGDQGYIPEINTAHLYLFTRNAKEFYIKTFDVRGVKLNLYNRYRKFLELKKEHKASNKSFIESIRPFLVLYKQLPDYSRHTKRLSPETLAIRTAIENSQDPEKVFFEDFPKALKTSIGQLAASKEALEDYIANLQTAIRELRSSLDDLVERIELFLIKEGLGDKNLKFPDYKLMLINRFGRLKEHQLLPKQRTFLMRINSPLDDRKSWISSIVHAVSGKPIEQLKDEDEEILKERLLHMIIEMDSLGELQNIKREEGEEIIKLDITTSEGLTKQIVRLPREKTDEAKKIGNEIKKLFAKDKRVNISALMDLLKDQLK